MSLQRDAIGNPSLDSYREQDAAQMCRICGECSDGLVSVFSKNGAKLDLINKIHTHLPIEVTPHDVLPLGCCYRCIDKLNACHELVNRCLEADWKLRSLLRGDKHLTKYSRGDQNRIKELDRRASLSPTILARNAIARMDDHSMHTPKTYEKGIVKGLKRKSPTFGKVDTLQEVELCEDMCEAQEKYISYSTHLLEVEKEDLSKTSMSKKKCSESTLPDAEKPIQAMPIKQKQKQTLKYKVVLVKLKNSSSLSKAVQVEEALKIVKTKQEAGDLPEAKGPVPKRLQKKLQGLKTYGLLKPNKYIRLPLEPRDFQTEDSSEILTVPPCNTDAFICPSCEKMFMGIDALNCHVASSHKDLLFCYCSQTFQTQTQLNEHLEMHVSEEIKSVASKSRSSEEIDYKPSKSRVIKEIQSEASKSSVPQTNESEASKCRLSEEIESKASKSRVKDDIESEPSKSHIPDDIESTASKSCVKQEIQSKLEEFCLKKEMREPSPTEMGEPLITQIVPTLAEETPWIKKLEDNLPNSIIRENVSTDLANSVDTSIRSSPSTKERISHDQWENATKLVDSRRSVNTGEVGNLKFVIDSFQSEELVDQKYIELGEDNTCGIDIKCESHVAFTSLGESRVLMDSMIASVPKTKTKIWRCPMCGLVYPGEDRWLKHCDGVSFRCHFCEVVLGSVLEQKQHETGHLKSNHIMQ